MRGKKIAEPSRKATPVQKNNFFKENNADNSSKSKKKTSYKNTASTLASSQANYIEKNDRDQGDYLFLSNRNNSAQSIQYAISKLNFDEILKKKHSLPITKESSLLGQSHQMANQNEFKIANLKSLKPHDMTTSTSSVQSSKPKPAININPIKENPRGDVLGNNQNKLNYFKNTDVPEPGYIKKCGNFNTSDPNKKLGPIGISIDNYFREKEKLLYTNQNGVGNLIANKQNSKSNGGLAKETTTDAVIDQAVKHQTQKNNHKPKENSDLLKPAAISKEETIKACPAFGKDFRIDLASHSVPAILKDNLSVMSARLNHDDHEKNSKNIGSSKYLSQKNEYREVHSEVENSKKQPADCAEQNNIFNRISTEGVKINRVQLSPGEQEQIRNDWWDSRRSSMNSQNMTKSGAMLNMKQDSKKAANFKDNKTKENMTMGKNALMMNIKDLPHSGRLSEISEGFNPKNSRNVKNVGKHDSEKQNQGKTSPFSENNNKNIGYNLGQKINNIRNFEREKVKLYEEEDVNPKELKEGSQKQYFKNKGENENTKDLDEIFNAILRKKIDYKLHPELGASPREMLNTIIASKKQKDTCFSHSNDSKKKLDELNDLLCKAFLENNEIIKKSYTNGSSESKKMKKMNHSSDITKKEIKSSERRGDKEIFMGKGAATTTSNFTISQDETQKLYIKNPKCQLLGTNNINEENIWESTGIEALGKLCDNSKYLRDPLEEGKLSDTENIVIKKGNILYAPTPFNSQILDESDLKELLNNPNIQNNSSKRFELSLLSQRNYSVNDVGSSDNKVAEFLKRKFSLDPKIQNLSITPRLQENEAQKCKSTRNNSNKFSDQVSCDKLNPMSFVNSDYRKNGIFGESLGGKNDDTDMEIFREDNYEVLFEKEKNEGASANSTSLNYTRFLADNPRYNSQVKHLSEKSNDELSYRRGSKPIAANIEIEEVEEEDFILQDKESNKKGVQRKDDSNSTQVVGSISDQLESLKHKMKRTLLRYKQKSDSLIMMNKILRNKLIIMNDE